MTDLLYCFPSPLYPAHTRRSPTSSSVWEEQQCCSATTHGSGGARPSMSSQQTTASTWARLTMRTREFMPSLCCCLGSMIRKKVIVSADQNHKLMLIHLLTLLIIYHPTCTSTCRAIHYSPDEHGVDGIFLVRVLCCDGGRCFCCFARS